MNKEQRPDIEIKNIDCIPGESLWIFPGKENVRYLADCGIEYRGTTFFMQTLHDLITSGF